ncbi:MAG: hypothetical protein GXO64_02445 [Candidatus Micrarchaeota archaeon]|nr:hypothetical protein [Candidatus Micrarchaeota archaeon]
MFKELNMLSFFFEKPSREFNVRETAKLLGISPATASKELKRFAKEGLLREREEWRVHLYRANTESDIYRDVKRFYNIRKLKDSGLLEELDRFYLRPAIILFGSYAQGMDTETSDVDIAVISEKRKTFLHARKFEKKIKRDLHIIPMKSMKDMKNTHLLNNILNGIVLRGKVRWI